MTAAESGSATPDGERERLVAAVGEEVAALVTSARSLLASIAARFHPQLQPAGFYVLRSLVRSGPTNAGVIAQRIGMDKSAISRQVHALKGLGLVEAQPDPADGRAHVLVPTSAALARMEEIRAASREVFRSRLDEWYEEDLAALAGLLRRFNETQTAGAESAAAETAAAGKVAGRPAGDAHR